MQNHRKNEIKVGLVSLMAIILLIIGITLGRDYSVSVSTQTIKFRFPNSGGITSSSPVVVNGVKRGSVSFVKNDKSSVLIEATIDDISDLRQDVSAKITILEITGGKKIEINPGSKGDVFNVKNEIPGFTSADLSDLVSIGGEMVGDLKVLLKKLDTISTSLTGLLKDGKFTGQIKQIVTNADVLISDARNLLENNKTGLSASLKNLNVISEDVKNMLKKDEPKIDELLAKLDKALVTGQSVLGKADVSLETVDVLLKDLKSITNEIRTGNGFVSKLLYDKGTAQKLDSTLAGLNELVAFIKQNGVNVNVRLGTRP